MKLRNNQLNILVLVFLLVPFLAFSKSDSTVGKVEFLSKSKREILVRISSKRHLYSLSVGNRVHVLKGKKKVSFKIVEKIEKYYRCRLIKDKSVSFSWIKEKQIVYDSVSANNKLKYYDFNNTLSQLISIYENFIYEIEVSDDPGVIANSMSKFASQLEKIIPHLNSVYDKYPELKNKKKQSSLSLKGKFRKLKLLEAGLRNSFFKIKNFKDNSDVKRESLRLEIIIKNLGKPKK